MNARAAVSAYSQRAMESRGDYLNRRAREEREAADRCTDPKVRGVHNELATRYREAADGPDAREAEADAAPQRCVSSDFRILE